jgi:hypothetical protein
MSDQLERFRSRQARVKILVTSMLIGAGVMFVGLGLEIARLL